MNAVDAKNAILLYIGATIVTVHCICLQCVVVVAWNSLHKDAFSCKSLPGSAWQWHSAMYDAYNVQCLTRGKHADMNWVLGKVRRLPRNCYSCSPETHWAINWFCPSPHRGASASTGMGRDGRGWGGKGETVAPPDGGPGNKHYFSFLSKSCLRCLKGWKLFWIIFQTQSVYEHHFKLWNYIIPWKYINIIRYQIALTARNDVYVLTKISKSAQRKTEAAPGRSGTASATLT